MFVRHSVDLAEIEDRQQVGCRVREPIGRQRHPVLGEVTPEMPQALNADRVVEMCLRVDHA